MFYFIVDQNLEFIFFAKFLLSNIQFEPCVDRHFFRIPASIAIVINGRANMKYVPFRIEKNCWDFGSGRTFRMLRLPWRNTFFLESNNIRIVWLDVVGKVQWNWDFKGFRNRYISINYLIALEIICTSFLLESSAIVVSIFTSPRSFPCIVCWIALWPLRPRASWISVYGSVWFLPQSLPGHTFSCVWQSQS